MPLTVRRARSQDAAVIAEFNRRLASETENKTLDPEVVAKGVAAILRDANKGLYFVAEENSAVVGQACVTFEWSDWRNGWIWWFQSVYVTEAARRKGVFRALYQHIHRAAKQAGDVISLRLYVEKDNQRAQATYADMGMRPAPYLVYDQSPL